MSREPESIILPLLWRLGRLCVRIHMTDKGELKDYVQVEGFLWVFYSQVSNDFNIMMEVQYIRHSQTLAWGDLMNVCN